MQGKPQDWMTVGIVHFMAFPQTMGGSGPIPETVRVIAEDPFFGAIELGPINDAAVRREVRDVVRSAHMQVGFGCQPIELANKLDPNSLDESTRQAAVAKIKEGIDMAADVGATRVAQASLGMTTNDPELKSHVSQHRLDMGHPARHWGTRELALIG